MIRQAKRYLNQEFVLVFGGELKRVKCIDIEFQTGLGPVFLMESSVGDRFWLTRRELKQYEVRNIRDRDLRSFL